MKTLAEYDTLKKQLQGATALKIHMEHQLKQTKHRTHPKPWMDRRVDTVALLRMVRGLMNDDTE